MKGRHAVTFDPKDVDGFTAKLVRGFYRFHQSQLLPPQTEIATFTIGEQFWMKQFEFIMSNSLAKRGVPPGLVYWFARTDEDPHTTVWWFLIWGQIFLQAASGQVR